MIVIYGYTYGRDSSKIHTTNPFVTEYQYKNRNEFYTSTLLEKISYSNDRPYIYAYDANGNITSISTENNGTQTLLVSYEYDALNQLVRENHAERNKTIVYTYDNGGNITSVKEYAYTTGAVSGTPIAEKTYTYGNTEWKDLLTNYNGTAITYDTIGNPLNWTNGKTFTWTAGRQLSGVTDANNTIAYTYDDNGIRTSKTVNGTKTDYYLNGTAIIMQKTGDQCIWYTYDESGNLSGLRVGNSEYYYYRNGEGDIIGIIDSTGSIAAKYSYDAWGTPIAITDGAGNDVSGNVSHIANINPFRYRGYFYDVETGLYYLQSRYYDPQVGRFVNIDNVISGNGMSIQGYNMFIYCFNNPVNMCDSEGDWPKWIKSVTSWVDKNIIQPIEEKVVQPIKKFIGNVISDIKNYDKNNESETKVIEANYFSSYKGTFVVKPPIGGNAASFGIMIIGDEVTSTNTVKHEYGHKVQLDNMGWSDYISKVAIPSVTANILDRMGKLPYDYYGSPWESEADRLGGVNRTTNNIPWPDDAYHSYIDLIKMFFD